MMPSQCIEYTDAHVKIHRAMVKRYLKIPHRYICITDSPVDGVECLPLWDKYRHLNGCFNRLYVFSKDMKDFIAPRFVTLDLDCVITGDITPLFDRKCDFVINSYKPVNGSIDQHYNGAMVLMNAGARSQVWEKFGPESLEIIRKNNEQKISIGTDQAWIRHILGKGEKIFTEEDGVYEVRQFKKNLPQNARLVFFAGKRDPTTTNYPWVKNDYCMRSADEAL